MIKYLLSIVGIGAVATVPAQTINWKQGIVRDEFIYDTAPYPSCHAATIAETPAGLVAAWFGGTAERNPDVCIYVSRMVNDTWQTPEKAADGVVNDTLRYACWNPVLYQVPGGALLLFYKVGASPGTWTGWLKRSTDNGLTWSKAEALPAGYLGPIKNKPVAVGDSLFCPSSTEGSHWRVHFEVTGDAGKTWSKIGPVPADSPRNAIQPSLLTYKNNRLQVLARSKNRTVLQSWSDDNGKTWSKLKPTTLPNNNSGTDAVTLQDGWQLLVYNHVLPPADARNGKGARTPLNVALSKDGEHWYASVVLEDSPISQYSYPSVIQSKDGMIHIVYTWRRKKIKYVQLDPAALQKTDMNQSGWWVMKQNDGKQEE